MLKIRSGAPADLARLLEIENAVFPGDRLSRRSLAHALKSPSLTLFTADWRGHVVGYALVSYRRGSRNARLFSIAADADAPRGVGRALLDACERDARKRACLRMRLETRYDNARAIAFYEKNEYRVFGQYENYYDDGATAARYEKVL